MSGGITLAPCGLIVERIESEAAALLIVARPAARTGVCPACGTVSAKVHSRYRRSLSDLPSQGRVVRIAVHARRFRCLHGGCGRKIFAERLETAVAGPFARRTARLEGLVQHLGLALGGRPGQSLARRLLLPVSKDTLLRVVRRHAAPIPLAPRVVGMTIGPGGAAIATGPSFAILNGGGSSICCRIARRRRPRRGSPGIRRLRSWRGIAAPGTSKPRPRGVRRPPRLQTAGT
jgi:hypothetical protein